MSRVEKFLKQWSARRAVNQRRRPKRFVSGFESLEPRLMLSVSAFFTPQGGGVLTVMGDALDNNIVVSRDTGGNLLVNGGAVAITGGTATVANTARIAGFGLGGNDTIVLEEMQGALPSANFFGGTGNDTLIGGSAGDMLFGQSGNDTVEGKGGADALFGGSENDVLTGGDENDQAFGESGNDRLIWNAGDDTDLNEGGSDIDTVEVNGGNDGESFAVTANGTRVRFDRFDAAPFSLDIGTSENLVVNANGGDDSIATAGNLAALIRITMDGGGGNDTLLGSNGVDVILGGDGNDLIDGNQGNDVAFLGAGDDTFQWDPGDASDVVEGQAGSDRLLFNGSGANENVDISANGGRVRVFRDVATVTMDLDDVEQINVKALGGTDKVTVGDVSGTDLATVNVDLAGTLGGTTGDGQIDTVIVNGTNNANTVDVSGSGTSYTVSGLPAMVNVQNTEASDRLIVNTLAGDDTVNASTLEASVVQLTIDGGTGSDTMLGGRGADVLLGGEGNDFVDGNAGNDVAFLGDGNDTFQWDHGDANDTIEGQAGADALIFNGSAANETIDIFANGGRARLFRDLDAVTMDFDDVERIDVNALGGTDTTIVGDLAGTDVTTVNLNLAGTLGGGMGDGQADQIIVNGSFGADNITLTGSGHSVSVTGLAAAININTVEGANDRLTVNALSGDDSVDASGLSTTMMSLGLNGGLGNDTLIGSQGNDLVSGGDGTDVALLGAGDDVFVWVPGDDSDTVEGQDGTDAILFNGANVGEIIDVAANGERVRVFRNVASVTMDLNDVEQLDFNVQGGIDALVVNDLSGTDVTEINVNLAASGGAGDLQPDAVIVHGTNGDDAIQVFGDVNGVAVMGLSAQVNITGAEASLDRLTINAQAGDDVVDASGLDSTGILLTADGGDGGDVLIGNAGDNVLLGGNGDDVLIGAGGMDILDGGPGDNIVI